MLDNAAGRDQVAELLPTHAAHRVLITSRHTLGDLGGTRMLDLGVLGESDSVALLDASLRARDPADRRVAEDPAGSGELARLGGRLPLALRIVASLLADDPALPVADLVAELADAGSRLGALSYEERSVRAAFDLSRRHLADRDGQAERLFRLLPVGPGPEISTEAAAVLAGEPGTAVRQRLRALHRAHLIEPGTAPGRWRMHDLVALFAAGLPEAEPGERSSGLDRLLRHYLTAADAADDHVRALPGQPVPDRFTDREAALAWLQAERPNLVAAVERAAEAGQHDVAAKLALALGPFLNFRHVTDDHLATATVAVREAAHLDPYWQAVAWDNLGVVLRKVRQFGEAIDAHQRGVDLCQQAGNRSGEAIVLSNLGAALQGAGRFDEALDAHQRAVEICRQVGDRYTEGRALNGLGMDLTRMARFHEAIAAHRDCVSILDGIGDRLGAGMASSNLGSALRKVGRVDEAVGAHQRAIEAFRDAGDRSGEGVAVANLGTALWEAGRFGEAIEHFARSVTMVREVGNLPVAGTALRNLGLALTGVGRTDEAVEALTQAVTVFAQAGDRHSEGLAAADLGSALRVAGRSDDARACWQRAADLLTEAGATGEAEEARRLLAEPG
ncbi:MAG TPA: tetratricopeptide repeat protein [Mycobacteriales bacterium]|nr:tetratricopeptide repeat protein [Mycobacteriales bacterium]